MIRTALLAGAIAIALCGAPAAQAQQAPDYLFNVPVDVKDLSPQLTDLELFCELRTSDRVLAGAGFTRVPITSGGFQGIVEVAVNRNTTVAGDPVSWRCFMQFSGTINETRRTWSGSQVPTEMRMGAAHPPNIPTVLPSKVGTTPFVQAEGTFTP